LRESVSVGDDMAIIAHDDVRYSSPFHRHAEGQLLYAVSGVVSVTTERGTWVVPPNRAVWLPPNMEHRTSSPSAVQFRSLLIGGKGIDRLPGECMVIEVSPLLRELILKLNELAATDERREMAVSVIRMLLAELPFAPMQTLNLPMPEDRELARFCETVRGDLSDDLSIAEAAMALKMSRATFMRLFRRETGMSFGRWRQQARMLDALVLLAEGRGILDVAFECGYESPSAFSAAFRRSLGQSPRSYFRSIRNSAGAE
jgi:AraC-like DNA-binding protein